jgi:hypothetical protein
VSRPLRFSRWKRLPSGWHRVRDQKVRTPDDEPQRLTLYLPGRSLDLAESLATHTGEGSAQDLCERLLLDALEAEKVRCGLADRAARGDTLPGLDAIEDDPSYLAEWSHAQTHAGVAPEPTPMVTPAAFRSPSPHPVEARPMHDPSEAMSALARHAGLGDPTAASADGFLPRLRRGEPPAPEEADDLLRALLEVESALLGQDQIDRRLAFVLHRLAFESQVLLTDAWPGLAADRAVLDTVRLVQQSVERVLSGQDIRYEASNEGGNDQP